MISLQPAVDFQSRWTSLELTTSHSLSVHMALSLPSELPFSPSHSFGPLIDSASSTSTFSKAYSLNTFCCFPTNRETINMAEDKHCYFLSLPREIRNMIYKHVTKDVLITHPVRETEAEDQEPPEKVTLLGTIFLSLLLVNRQVHNEYIDYTLSKSHLVLNLPHGPELPEDLGLSAKFRLNVLKKVRQCAVTMHWCHPGKGPLRERAAAWCNQNCREDTRIREATKWTPSKGVMAICSQRSFRHANKCQSTLKG